MKRKIKISRFSSFFLRKGMSLALSFLIHLGLIGSLVYFFPPCKIYFEEEKVTDVMIAPQEKLFIPSMEEIFEDPEKDFIRPPSSMEPSRKGKSSGEERAEERFLKPELSQEPGSPQTSLSKKESSSEEGNFPFRFHLSSTSSSQHSLEKELRISPYRGFEELGPGEIGEEASPQKLNLGEYSGRGTSSFSGSSLSAFPVFPTRGSPAEGGGYDLTPWAEKVMDSVNKNWVIPSSKEKPFIEKVKITVVVQKNGKLMFMETIKSSGFDSFNQAALEALALSAPFPELPPNFSGETLQMDFIFDYVHVQD